MFARSDEVEVFALDLVHHVLEVREVRHPLVRRPPEHVRRAHGSEPAFHEQVEGESLQGEVDQDDRSLEVVKPGAASPAGAVEVRHAERLQGLGVRLEPGCPGSGFTPRLYHDVLGIVLAVGDGVVEEIGEAPHQGVAGQQQLSFALFDLLHRLWDRFRFRVQGGRWLPLRPRVGDSPAEPVPRCSMEASYGLFIDGRWAAPPKAKRFETRNPATREPVGSFVSGTAEDAVRAVASAKKAFPGWRDTPAPKRGEILLTASRIMRERKYVLGGLVTTEMGKVIGEGLGDVQESIDFIEYMSGEGRRLFGETVPSELRSKFCMTVRQPKGVVACITPWNFPTAIPNWKIAAALVTGNTIVFKPASTTARCGAEVVRIYEAVGIPPGVLNFVTGSGGVVGNALVADPRIRTVSFTGGVEAGRDVYVRGAQGLKMVHLEL